LEEPKGDIFDTIDVFGGGAVSADPTIPQIPAASSTPPVDIVTSEDIPEETKAPPLIQPAREPREFTGFFSELGTALQRGAARTGAAGLQFIERLSTPGSIFEPGTFSDLAEPLQDFAESAKVQPATIPKDAPTKDKVKAFVANAVGETIPFMGAATASVLATGTPMAAFGTSFAVEGEGARQDALAAGASEDQADLEAFVVGTINGALEKLQIDEVLNFAGVGRGSIRALIDAAKKKSLRKIAKEGGKLTLELAKTSVTEGVQEALQETTSVLAPAVTGRELPTLEEGAKRVGLAAAGGAVAGPILGGAISQITPSGVEGEVITSVKEQEDGGQRDEERREELRARDRLVESEQRAEEAKAPVEARKRVVLEEGRQGLTDKGAVEAAPAVAKLRTEEPDGTIIEQTPQIRQDVSDAVEFDPEKPTTSARQAQIDEDRESLGLKEINSPARRGWNQALKQAKDTNIPARANAIADEVITSPRALSDVETAGMTLKMSELKSTHKQLSSELDKAKDPADIQSIGTQITRIEQDFDNLSQAVRASGTEKGRALASQKLTIDEDMSLVSVLNRAKANKRSDLTVQERKQFTKTIKALEQRVSAIEQARSLEATIIAKGQLRRGNKRFTTMSKAQRKASSKVLGSDVKSLLERGCAN
jgi:hypothetical protein